MLLSYHLTAVLSSKLEWLDHCYNIVKNAFQKVRPLHKRKRQRLFIKCCITELINYLFFPDELLVFFIFILYMYMFIEETKLFTLNLELNSRVRYFWYFSQTTKHEWKRFFSEKSCLRNERKSIDFSIRYILMYTSLTLLAVRDLMLQLLIIFHYVKKKLSIFQLWK